MYGGRAGDVLGCLCPVFRGGSARPLRRRTTAGAAGFGRGGGTSCATIDYVWCGIQTSSDAPPSATSCARRRWAGSACVTCRRRWCGCCRRSSSRPSSRFARLRPLDGVAAAMGRRGVCRRDGTCAICGRRRGATKKRRRRPAGRLHHRRRAEKGAAKEREAQLARQRGPDRRVRFGVLGEKAAPPPARMQSRRTRPRGRRGGVRVVPFSYYPQAPPWASSPPPGSTAAISASVMGVRRRRVRELGGEPDAPPLSQARRRRAWAGASSFLSSDRLPRMMSGTWPRSAPARRRAGAAAAPRGRGRRRGRGGRRRALRVERHHLRADLDLVVDCDRGLDDARRVRRTSGHLVRVMTTTISSTARRRRPCLGQTRPRRYRVAHRGHVRTCVASARQPPALRCAAAARWTTRPRLLSMSSAFWFCSRSPCEWRFCARKFVLEAYGKRCVCGRLRFARALRSTANPACSVRKSKGCGSLASGT